MVAALLTEWSLPIPDDLGSNQQFSWNIIFRYCQMSFEKTKLMKSSWELPIFKANVLFNNFPYGRYLPTTTRSFVSLKGDIASSLVSQCVNVFACFYDVYLLPCLSRLKLRRLMTIAWGIKKSENLKMRSENNFKTLFVVRKLSSSKVTEREKERKKLKSKVSYFERQNGRI